MVASMHWVRKREDSERIRDSVFSTWVWTGRTWEEHPHLILSIASFPQIPGNPFLKSVATSGVAPITNEVRHVDWKLRDLVPWKDFGMSIDVILSRPSQLEENIDIKEHAVGLWKSRVKELVISNIHTNIYIYIEYIQIHMKLWCYTLHIVKLYNPKEGKNHSIQD